MEPRQHETPTKANQQSSSQTSSPKSPPEKQSVTNVTPGGTLQGQSTKPKTGSNVEKVKRKLNVGGDSASTKTECQICQKKISKAHISRHQKTHEEKAFKCGQCARAYHRLEHLQSHVRNQHHQNLSESGSICLDCPSCCYQSSRSIDYFRRHMRSKHSDQIGSCSRCGNVENEVQYLDDAHLVGCCSFQSCELLLPQFEQALPQFVEDAEDEPPQAVIDALEPYSDDSQLLQIIDFNWSEIRQRVDARVPDVARQYFFRALGAPTFRWREALTRIYQDVGRAFNVCAAVTVLLHKQETEEDDEQWMVFHGQDQRGSLTESNLVIYDQTSLNKAIETLEGFGEIEDYIARPGSSWVLFKILSYNFFVHLRAPFLAGRGAGKLPAYIAHDSNLLALERDRNGNLFSDSLCFFRALVASFADNPYDKQVVHSCYEKFRMQFDDVPPDEFPGLAESRLCEVEALYKIKVQLFTKLSKNEIECVRRCTDPSDLQIVNLHYYPMDNEFAHYSLIKNIDGFLHRFECAGCSRLFRRRYHLTRHQKDSCRSGKPEHVFPSGTYKCRKNVFEELEEWSIRVPQEKRLARHIACFDIECSLVNAADFVYTRKADQLHQEDIEERLTREGIPIQYQDTIVKRQQIMHIHRPITIALASSVEDGCRFFHDPQPEVLAQQLVDALVEISEKAEQLEREKFKDEFERLQEIRGMIKLVIDNDDGSSKFRQRQALRRLDKLISRFDLYCSQLSVITYNGGRYDLIALKSVLLTSMVAEVRKGKARFVDNEENDQFDQTTEETMFEEECQEDTIGIDDEEVDDEAEGFGGRRKDVRWPRALTRSSKILCLSTDKLRLIDAINYQAVGTSLSDFLKAYNPNGEEKGAFPYYVISEYEDLERIVTFPRIEQFFSPNRPQITPEKYAEAKNLWDNMDEPRNMLSYIAIYNRMDTAPFLDACLNFSQKLFELTTVDIFKDCVSIPGCAMITLFRQLAIKFPCVRFGLPGDDEAELATSLAASICGGLATVNKRLVESGKTPIRTGKHIAKKVVGYDANSLYLFSIGKDMPTDKVSWWVLDEVTNEFQLKNKLHDADFKARRIAKEVQYLKFREWLDHSRIETAYDGAQVQLGISQVRVDGWSAAQNKVYFYNGCKWHAHRRSECLLKNRNFDADDPGARERFQHQIDELSELNFSVDIMNECRWLLIERTAKLIAKGQRHKITPDLSQFVNTAEKLNEYQAQLYKRPFAKEKKVSEIKMRQAILDGSCYGFCNVDIRCKDEFRDLYSDFPPLIKNTLVSFEDVGPYMQEIATAEGKLKKPVRSLIASYHGQGLWLHSEMIRFICTNGCDLIKIREVAQFSKEAIDPFRWFQDLVTENRRKADLDDSLKQQGEFYKLIGNASYGKTITNQSLHKEVFFCDKLKAIECANDPYHSRTLPLSDDCFEVHMRPKRIVHALPNVIGLTVYSHSKLHMLRFFYLVLLRFLDFDKFEMCESDTDSIYIAISEDDIDACVKPDMREEWFETKWQWFANPDDPLAKRTGGLFKLERWGDCFCGLSPKCYCLYKISICSDYPRAKGNQLSNINRPVLVFKNYRAVLLNEPSAQRQVHNIMFRSLPGVPMASVIQEKVGLSRLAIKRIFFCDGSSIPLNI